METTVWLTAFRLPVRVPFSGSKPPLEIEVTFTHIRFTCGYRYVWHQYCLAQERRVNPTPAPSGDLCIQDKRARMGDYFQEERFSGFSRGIKERDGTKIKGRQVNQNETKQYTRVIEEECSVTMCLTKAHEKEKRLC